MEENKPVMHVSVSLNYQVLNMDNKLQVLLILFSMLEGVVQLFSAFHYVTTAYMRWRKDIIQQTETVL